MNKSESVVELFKALSKFQGELENVEKSKSGHGYKYATLGNCIDAAKAPLASNGLSVSQLMGSNDKGESTMQTVLAHESGEYISSICVMPIAKLAGGGASNPAQILGASITYMRRYQYAAIIGLAQDDTDATTLTNVDKEWIKGVREGTASLDNINDRKYRKFIESNL
tara:strand:- start:6 stop:509 length:504 start_codon:yes stop_codon:yes gene_type:complete